MEIDLRKIRRIAKSVRRWTEEYAEAQGFCHTLLGLCAIASGRLHQRLQACKVQSIIIENKHHCFLLVGEYVVDITATQFKYVLEHSAPVFIQKYSDVKHHEFYKKTIRHKSVDSLRIHQQKIGWPRNQIALTS